MGEVKAYISEQSYYPQHRQNRQAQEAFDLLTLVNQSYQALNIGELCCIDDLRRAVEDVESVKKLFLEKNSPADTESLGLASTIASSEELETYIRMVSFFEKKKPERGINWEMFHLSEGVLRLRSEQERADALLKARRKEAVDQLIQAIEQAEALGLEVFRRFDSPVILREEGGYRSRI